jgi:molybdenum cofactor biosynthesis protein B
MRKIRIFGRTDHGAAYISLDYMKQEGELYRVAAEDAQESGLLKKLLAGKHASIVSEYAGRKIVRDEPDQVRAAISEELASPNVQVIITTGGTGITSRDTTFEAIDSLLEKRLDGFGELFRMLSFQEIGSAAMLSRACAGLVKKKVIISLPGSENAVRLAMTKLVLPELGHLVREASR